MKYVRFSPMARTSRRTWGQREPTGVALPLPQQDVGPPGGFARSAQSVHHLHLPDQFPSILSQGWELGGMWGTKQEYPDFWRFLIWGVGFFLTDLLTCCPLACAIFNWWGQGGTQGGPRAVTGTSSCFLAPGSSSLISISVVLSLLCLPCQEERTCRNLSFKWLS